MYIFYINSNLYTYFSIYSVFYSILLHLFLECECVKRLLIISPIPKVVLCCELGQNACQVVVILGVLRWKSLTSGHLPFIRFVAWAFTVPQWLGKSIRAARQLQRRSKNCTVPTWTIIATWGWVALSAFAGCVISAKLLSLCLRTHPRVTEPHPAVVQRCSMSSVPPRGEPEVRLCRVQSRVALPLLFAFDVYVAVNA